MAIGLRAAGATSKKLFEEMGASSMSEKLFASLGGIGNKGALTAHMARGKPIMGGLLGEMSPATRDMARGNLQSMGKRRAMYGGAGLGAIGLSSGASGMRAKSSGGYTG